MIKSRKSEGFDFISWTSILGSYFLIWTKNIYSHFFAVFIGTWPKIYLLFSNT